MPSFDITSKANMEALKNAVDVTARQIGNRYDFKGTSAAVEINDQDKRITIYADNDFQLNQIKDLLYPAMEKKDPESSKRLEQHEVQKVSGNKVKQVLKICDGIDSELAKRIIKLIKDSGLKLQASIHGDAVRVSGTKRDTLQEAIAYVRQAVMDFPLQFGNFRD